MTSRKRARAREIALQALYQYDLRSRGRPETATETLDDLRPFVSETAGDREVARRAFDLLDGTVRSLPSLDARIKRAVEHWKIERVAPVDRCIIRLALHELIDDPEVPPKVAINEAIELAKKFSTAQSGAFVNGILDRIYRDMQAERSDSLIESGDAAGQEKERDGSIC